MNLEILQEYISEFNHEVIDSGFKRDIDDFVSSLPASQGNIVALRDIAEKVLADLDRIYMSDLPEGLNGLLPKAKLRPFTEEPHDEMLRKIIENTEIQQQEFYNQLTQYLNKLHEQLNQNIKEINSISQFIAPYISEDVKRVTEENGAIIAIIFHDRATITNLKEFTRTLSAWNRILPIYHQLLKSESPQDIQIVEVQNGSIDFIVNLNIDVALDLVDLFEVGFKVFAAYLSYKKLVKPIVESYYGDEKLIEGEDEREKQLLGNVGAAVQRRIKEQHKTAKESDRAVDDSAIPKKVEQVARLVTSHIVKGNDFKLLALPEGDSEETDEITTEKKDSLRAALNPDSWTTATRICASL